MKASGKVHKYGNNIDTDVIIPARYLNTADHKELAPPFYNKFLYRQSNGAI